jgi:GLPGLI family protein
MPSFGWTTSNERQTILSYDCQKATTTFRGRDYCAWFTTDIPVYNGPWQFGGLPGLILKIHDVNENFVFECTGIEYLSLKKEPVKYYLVEYTELSRNEYIKLNKRLHDDYIQYENLYGIQVILVDPATRKELTKTTLKLSYNPIELE